MQALPLMGVLQCDRKHLYTSPCKRQILDSIPAYRLCQSPSQVGAAREVSDTPVRRPY